MMVELSHFGKRIKTYLPNSVKCFYMTFVNYFKKIISFYCVTIILSSYYPIRKKNVVIQLIAANLCVL